MSFAYDQPDATTIRAENPLLRVVLGAIVFGLVFNLFIHHLYHYFSTVWAIVLISGAFFAGLAFFLSVFSHKILRVRVALAYLGPTIAIPLLYFFALGWLSPTLIFTLLFPLCVAGLNYVAKDIVIVGATLKAAHQTTTLETRVAAKFCTDRFGKEFTEEEFAEWLPSQIKRLTPERTQRIVRNQDRLIRNASRLASGLRQLRQEQKICVIAFIVLVWIVSFVPVYTTALQGLTVLLGVLVLFLRARHHLPRPLRKDIYRSALLFANRYFDESPPEDKPFVYVPGTGDWLMRVCVIAASIIALTSVTISTGGYFFPPWSYDQFSYEITDPGAAFEDPDIAPLDLRDHADNWMPGVYEALDTQPLRATSTFFVSLLLSIGIPLLLCVTVVFYVAQFAHLYDWAISFLPDEE